MALGTVPETSLWDAVKHLDIHLYRIGDCLQVRRATEAIREGFEAGLEI
jgi:hypothetical protein